MLISTKGRYALRVMIDLAEHQTDGYIPLKEVAQRQDILLNDNWKFRFSHQVQKGSEIRVDLPHTWNTQDALSGKIDYKRGIGNY